MDMMMQITKEKKHARVLGMRGGMLCQMVCSRLRSILSLRHMVSESELRGQYLYYWAIGSLDLIEEKWRGKRGRE